MKKGSVSHKRVEIELMMIGDMLMHGKILQSGLCKDGTYKFDHLFQNILSDISGADIRIVNQETIIAGEEFGISGYPRFNSPFALGDAEEKAGFNVILCATNHALDKGLNAVEKCRDYWDTRHPNVAVLGISRTKDEYDQIYVYEKAGFRVAVLNYTFVSNVWPIPKSKPYCLHYFDRKKMLADIKKAKQCADMVVVCPHWGTEYVHSTDFNQRKWTEFFLSAGVDIVIGTHPHVLEPVEMLCDSAGHRMLVYYSLGNFISNQSDISRNVGGMAKVILVKDSKGCYVSQYSLIPLISHRTSDGICCTYKLSDYTDALVEKSDIKTVYGFNDFSVKFISDLCAHILGDDFHAEEGRLQCDLLIKEDCTQKR